MMGINVCECVQKTDDERKKSFLNILDVDVKLSARKHIKFVARRAKITTIAYIHTCNIFLYAHKHSVVMRFYWNIKKCALSAYNILFHSIIINVNCDPLCVKRCG